jgi:hypothetical protein
MWVHSAMSQLDTTVDTERCQTDFSLLFYDHSDSLIYTHPLVLWHWYGDLPFNGVNFNLDHTVLFQKSRENTNFGGSLTINKWRVLTGAWIQNFADYVWSFRTASRTPFSRAGSALTDTNLLAATPDSMTLWFHINDLTDGIYHVLETIFPVTLNLPNVKRIVVNTPTWLKERGALPDDDVNYVNDLWAVGSLLLRCENI